MESPIESTPIESPKPSRFAGLKAQLKRPRTIVLAVVPILVLVLFGQACGNPQDTQTEEPIPTVNQVRAELFARSENDIATSGEVRASSEVTILSEANTPVDAVYVELGQYVEAGQPLVEFVHADLDAQLDQALAGLARAQATLDVQAAGARQEERVQAELAVQQAELTLQTSKTTRDQTYTSVENTLVAAYENGAAAAGSAFTTAIDANLTIAQYQEGFLNCRETVCFRTAAHKKDALKILVGVEDGGYFNRTAILQADGGLRADIDSLSTINPQTVKQSLEALDSALEDTRLMLLEAREALEAGFAAGDVTDADRTVIDTERAAIVAAIASVRTNLQTIRTAEAGVLARQATNLSEIRYQDHPSVVSAEAAVTANTIALENARQNLSIAQNGAREVDLAVARASVAEAEAAYNALSSRLRQVQITAPISGVVSAIPAKTGRLIPAGQPVVEIVNADVLEVTTYITANAYAQVKYGTPAVIDDAYSGIVTAVSPAVNSTGKIEVKVAIQDAVSIPVGSFVSVTLKPQVANQSTTYAIPLSAVQLTANGAFVYHTGSASQVVNHPVTIGEVIGDRIEVTSGLNDETVFIESIQGLEIGDVVNVK